MVGLAALSCVVLARPADAEWFADVYIGPVFTTDTDIRIQAPAVTSETIVFQDVRLDDSVAAGGRVGHWFDGLPWLGVAVDVLYFQQDIPAQAVRATVIGAGTLAHMDAEALGFTADLMARWGWLRGWNYRYGRLQMYALFGLGVFLVEITDTTTLNPPRQSANDTALGFKTGAGVAWLLLSSVAIFAEYRYTEFSPDFRLRDRGAAERIETDIRSHHVVAGVSIRF